MNLANLIQIFEDRIMVPGHGFKILLIAKIPTKTQLNPALQK